MATGLTRKSTNVRALGPGMPRLLRAAMRTLDLAAPPVAARLAVRIWATPPKPRRSRPGAGTTGAGTTGAGTTGAGAPGERFATTLAADPRWATRPRWRPRGGRQFAVPAAARGMVVAEVWGEGPAIYLLHGWGGWRGQLAGLAEPLAAAGYRVVALDALGHGESGAGRLGGRRTTLVEAAEAVTAVAAVTGPAHAVIAHSAGCLGAALAVQAGLPAGRLVFIAPLADPMPYAYRFTGALGLSDRSRPAFQRRITALIDRDPAELSVPAVAGRAGPGELPPLLVIHDRHDREIGYADGCAVAAAWPGSRLLTTDGLGHRRILADPAVIAATVAFATAEPTGAEPTGAEPTGADPAGTEPATVTAAPR